MSPSLGNRILLGAGSLVAAVGAVDAALGSHWDLFVLFLALLLLDAVLLFRISLRRPAVPLRADLVAWLERQADLTGEPMARLADRSVAAYRAGLTGATHEQD